MRKIFFDNLPRWETGRTQQIGTIHWEKSIGYKVKFIYDDVEGWIEILGCKREKKLMLTIKYNDNIRKMDTTQFQMCKIGRLIGKYTSDFAVEVSTRFQDNKRDVTIIDREYRKDKNNRTWKYYKYKCNICGYDEGWVTQNNLLQFKQGCSCCHGLTAVLGKNTIYDTDKWMIPYVGEKIAKKYTCCSNVYCYPTCPNCGRTKSSKLRINSIYKNKSIGCACSDKVPYGEKFMFSVLEQLNVDFKTQLSKTTLEWCGDFKYDFSFILNNERSILETHGIQHYEDSFKRLKSRRNKRTIEEEQENDRLKKELAYKNNIKEENYIVIDCRESELGWIKEKILSSHLNNACDFDKVDWLKSHEFACSSLVKVASELKNNNTDLTVRDIAKIMNYGLGAVRGWLKKGTELGWCSYDAKEETIKSGVKSGKALGISDETLKVVCELKNNNPDLSTGDIGKMMKCESQTVRKWLIKGNELGWCTYDPKEETRRSGVRTGNTKGKPVEIFKNGISLGVFKSVVELHEKSKELFGTQLSKQHISNVCNGSRKVHKGCTFKYISQ